MRRSKIGDDVLEALDALTRLTPRTVEHLVDELEAQLPLKLILDEDIEQIVRRSTALDTLSSEDKAELSDVIGGVHTLFHSGKTSISEFIKDVSDAYVESLDETDSQADAQEKAAKLQNNLRQILRVKQIFASTKAISLLNDHERLFIKSRIITDVRPIFEEDVALPIIGSVITHSLKLTVRVNGKIENCFVTLDSLDLFELQETIKRAIEKSNEIGKSMSSEAGMSQFGKLIELDGNE